MGKRKSRAERSKTPPSDVLPPSSQMEGSSERRSSDQVGSSTMGSISSILETFDNPKKPSQVPHLSSHHHHFSRSMLYKNPRYCSRKYYRRNVLNYGDASTSLVANDAHPADGSMILKFSNKHSSPESVHHTESFEGAFMKPERIRSSSFGTDVVSGNAGKMVCGICERPVRKKLHSSGGIGSSSDLSVVAVLVCGHVFHVECLEQKTCQTAQMDPPCPMCPRVISTQVDAPIEQE